MELRGYWNVGIQQGDTAENLMILKRVAIFFFQQQEANYSWEGEGKVGFVIMKCNCLDF